MRAVLSENADIPQKLRAPLVLVSASFLLFGCAARSYVTSQPSGARISVNERFKGTTPVRVSIGDEFGIGSIYVFKAELDGYKTQVRVFKEVAMQDANEAIPGGIHFVLEPAEYTAETRIFGESVETPWGRLRLLGYEFDTISKKGTFVVDVSGKGVEVRDWVLKNIGKIASSREVLKAGEEGSSGGQYTVLRESVAAGILTVEFVAKTGR